MLNDEAFTLAAERMGFDLSSAQMEAFRLYERHIREWAERVRLVSRGDREKLRERHFLDSLSAAAIFPSDPFDLLDLGSGAGLPGIPLKIVRPELRVDLLEPARMKVLFLRNVIGELALDGLRVIRGRAPDCRDLRPYRIVTARAVAPLKKLWECSAGYLGEAGELVAYKGPEGLADFEGPLPEEVRGEQMAVSVPHLGRERTIVRLWKERGQQTTPSSPPTR